MDLPSARDDKGLIPLKCPEPGQKPHAPPPHPPTPAHTLPALLKSFKLRSYLQTPTRILQALVKTIQGPRRVPQPSRDRPRARVGPQFFDAGAERKTPREGVPLPALAPCSAPLSGGDAASGWFEPTQRPVAGLPPPQPCILPVQVEFAGTKHFCNSILMVQVPLAETSQICWYESSLLV